MVFFFEDGAIVRYWAWRVEFLVGGMRQGKVGVGIGVQFVCLFVWVRSLLACCEVCIVVERSGFGFVVVFLPGALVALGFCSARWV